MNRRNNQQYAKTLNTILVSKQLRRLKGKKQVFSLIGQKQKDNVKYDYIHERLLHTLEVYSIAKDIAVGVTQATFKMFNKEGNKTTKHFPYSDELLEAICFAHDFGHTPFGHVGETALTHCMRGINGTIREFKSGKAIKSDLAFKHNYYSACLLIRKYPNCPSEIIDGVLKHTSTITFDGEDIAYPWIVFGANAYLPEILKKIPGYLNNKNAFTFEGQVVAIADEIAQVLSDMEDSKIVLDTVFSDKEEKEILYKKESCSLKSALIRVRKALVNGVVSETCSNLYKHFKNAKKYEDQILFDNKIVNFNQRAKKIYNKIDKLRVGKLHKNDLVLKQNCLSYLIIYKVFDFYLSDINNLFKNDISSASYINNNLCDIRDDSRYKKGENNKQFVELKRYLSDNKRGDILESLESLKRVKLYNHEQVRDETKNELLRVCNFLAEYYFDCYGNDILSNQVLDRMTASLLREISYSIAKMTDRYALSIFDLSFGHSIERINQYIDKCSKKIIHTKQFDMKPEYSLYLKDRIKVLLGIDK